MSSEASALQDPLATFEKQQSVEGLLRRYAAGRVANFFQRQYITMAGAATLAIVVSPLIGLMVALAALVGESLDCLLLYFVPHLLDRGVSLRRVQLLTTMTAVIQAGTITFCVSLVLLSPDRGAAMFFSMAFITGAAINAGITLPFHHSAALARLSVYFISMIWMLTEDVIEDGLGDWKHQFFEAVAIVIMIYVIGMLLAYVNRSTRGHMGKNRALIKRQMEIEEAYKTLESKEIETRKLALVAEQAHDIVIMCDMEGRITWVNAAFTKITGYSPEEAIGRTPDDLLSGPETDSDVSDKIRQASIAGQPYRAEIQSRTKSGKKIWLETNLAPVLDDEGKPLMTVAIERDISQAKQLEKNLDSARISAENSARAKSDFLAAMSHEIRTPMNGIMGMSDLLCEADLPGECRQFADTIRDSSGALLKIINDVLDLSKLGAGKFEISSEVFSLQDCLTGTIELLKQQAVDKGVGLDLVFEEKFPKYMLGDDGRIRQIMINLIGNALKFTSTGGVGVHVFQKADDSGHCIEIQVRDTGIGIPADKLEHIFDKFSQADVSTTRRFGGTGLGLTISQLLARRMGGDITVTSKEGEGSCFTVTFRLGVAQEKMVKQKAEPVAIDSSTFAGLRVLVAEDNRTNRLIMKKFLANQPITLDFVENGLEAVEKAKTDLPDLIFMDVSMPEMDGLEATGVIRASDMPQPVIVALTANAFESDRKACLDAGMDDFLSKPVRRVELLGKMALTRGYAEQYAKPEKTA